MPSIYTRIIFFITEVVTFLLAEMAEDVGSDRAGVRLPDTHI
jgi:hypothetical protein